MKFSFAVLPVLAASVQALSTFSGNMGVNFAISIPSTTAQSGNGDIYFQLKGPASFQWVAMGFGQQMAGSSIFVMYADGNGNVTISPRAGKGEFQPLLDSSKQVELLSGSGIVDNEMIANVKCSNCESWNGGNLDFTSTSQSLIYAYHAGNALDTTSTSATLQKHPGDGFVFTFDLTQATGGDDNTNPFVASSVTNPSTGATTGTAPTNAPGATNIPTTGSSGSSGVSSGSSSSDISTYQKAHGTLMGLTVALMFPLGAMSIRLLNFKGLIWFHAGWQALSLILLTAGFGVGVKLAKDLNLLYKSQGGNDGAAHTIFGTTLFALFWIQPFGGYLHHVLYKRTQGRTAVSYGHIWLGRVIIICAIVNGGIGLHLADNTTGGKIAYGVVAGIFGLAFLAVGLWSDFRPSKSNTSGTEKLDSPKEQSAMSENRA